MARVILVGCGHMGYAMLSGWIASGRLPAAEALVVEPNEALRQRAAALGVHVASGPENLADAPELVVMAVKPQVIQAVLAGYTRFGNGRTTFLSVAAGTTIATFHAILGDRTPVIRCMPNTPAAIGKGMMVTFSTPGVPASTAGYVAELLASSGAVTSIPAEALMDAVTAVSGSGPGYVFHFIEALTAAAESVGLAPEAARLLARQTVYGAAALAFESGEEAKLLREQVTSPNGTTAAGLKVLMAEDGLTALMTRAVEAARDRGIELGK